MEANTTGNPAREKAHLEYASHKRNSGLIASMSRSNPAKAIQMLSSVLGR
jgi:hypothetical protein